MLSTHIYILIELWKLASFSLWDSHYNSFQNFAHKTLRRHGDSAAKRLGQTGELTVLLRCASVAPVLAQGSSLAQSRSRAQRSTSLGGMRSVRREAGLAFPQSVVYTTTSGMRQSWRQQSLQKKCCAQVTKSYVMMCPHEFGFKLHRHP